MVSLRRLSVLALLALVLSGCTLWLDVGSQGVQVRYDGPDLVAGTPDEADPLGEWIPTPDTWQEPCVGTAAVPSLRVRDGVWGVVIGAITPDAPVRILSSDTDGAGNVWYAIDEPPGWVHGDYVRLADGLACEEYQ